MLSSLKEFLSYWYFRYLMVTELYMVEKWERNTIHIFFLILFATLSYFNNNIVLSFTSNLFGLPSIFDNTAAVGGT